MAKIAKCTFCGEEGHYQTFCRNKPRKPIGTVTDITEQWKAKNTKNYKPSEIVNKKLYIKVTPKISPISDKQKVRLARYRVARDEYMRQHGVCQAQLDRICTYKATDLHHRAGRVGELLWDTRYFLAVCRGCHQLIEREPAMAKEKGFSLDRLDK